MRIVRDHHDRLVEVFIQALQNLQHFRSRMTVEISGRLVSEQQSWIADNRPSDGHALFLPTGELLGQVVDTIFQSNQFQSGHDVVAALLGSQFGQQQRQLHVLKCGKHGNQVERLKTVANVLVCAEASDLRVGEGEDIFSFDQQFSAGGPVNRRDDIQQRGLADRDGPIRARSLSLSDVDGDVSSAVTWKASRLKILLTPRTWTTLVSVATLVCSAVLMIALNFNFVSVF